MKTIKFLSAILVASIFFTSCEKDEFDVVPSGRVVTQTVPATDINYLDVSSLFNVYVTFSGTEESVIIESNENLQSLIDVEHSNGRLIVELEDARIIGDPVLNVFITTKSIEKIVGEGAVTFKFENQLDNSHIEIELTGASKLSGNINTDVISAKIEGASKLDLTGFANNSSITAYGASDMTGFNFVTNKLNTKLEGGCSVSLTVQQSLKVDARGASKVYYKGTGVVESQKLNDASEIIKVN
jgi:hypothetical protein